MLAVVAVTAATDKLISEVRHAPSASGARSGLRPDAPAHGTADGWHWTRHGDHRRRLLGDNGRDPSLPAVAARSLHSPVRSDRALRPRPNLCGDGGCASLNVRSANMSALPDDPGHFDRWLGRQAPLDTGEAQTSEAGTFASRRLHGRHLRALLYEEMARSGGRLRWPDRRAVPSWPGVPATRGGAGPGALHVLHR